MEVRRYDEPRAFRRDADRILMHSPGRSSLPLAVLQTLADQPEVYPQFHLWLALSEDGPAGLAMQTPPHNVILADPLDQAAIEPLAEAVLADGVRPPGVIANVPFAEVFASHLASGGGLAAELSISEGVFELSDVNDVPPVSGSARPAVGRDGDLIRDWLRAFAAEALPPDHPHSDDASNMTVENRLAGKGGGFWIWEDGGPVSFSGHTDVPRVGSRIGPVYTPPGHRGKGYATRLVAELSAARLAMGDPACFLFTDLANETSNSIYERIGYVKLCEAEEYALRGPT